MPQDEDRPSYTNDEARFIFKCAFKDGSVNQTRHSRLRMRQYSLDNNDLRNLAKKGIIYNPPEKDINTGEWKYRIESNETRAVFIIETTNLVRIITFIPVDS